MPTTINPIEFAYQWNEGGTFLALCAFFDRSPASCLAYAGTCRHKGFELRDREEETTGDRNQVYLPSQEHIRIECLKIQQKRGMTPRSLSHSEPNHYDGKISKHFPKREIEKRVSITRILKEAHSDEA